MTININLSSIESKTQTKQTRTETESWIQGVFGCLPDGKGCGGMGEEARGLKISSYRIAMGM